MIETTWKQRRDREGRVLPDRYEFVVRCSDCGGAGTGYVDIADALRIGSDASCTRRPGGSLHVSGILADRAADRAYAQLAKRQGRSSCGGCAEELRKRASRAPHASGDSAG